MKPIKNLFLLFSLSLLLFYGAACSQIPISTKTRGIVEDLEKKYSAEKRFNLNEYPEYKDPKISAYLNNLAKKICELYDIKPIPVQIADTVEAQAMIEFDGPTIYISKGMLYAIKSEAELIALLGHEIGHKYLKHDKKEYKSSKLPQVVGDVVETATGLPVGEEVTTYLEDLDFSQFNQKKEQEADQFGVLAAQKIGLNPYAFSDLFERLYAQADVAVIEQLKNVYKGSHQSLQQRAVSLRSYLQSKKIADGGSLNADQYLKVVRQLAKAFEKLDKSPRAVQAQKNLDALNQRLVARESQKSPLTIEEFLAFMGQIRSAAKDLGALAQLRSTVDHLLITETNNSSDDELMMELVRVLRPWWVGVDVGLEKLQMVLTMLARMGVGSLPVVGDAIDFYELLTGKDFVTGEPLTFGERVSSALGLGIGAGQQWRAAIDGADKLKLPRGISVIDPKEVRTATEKAKEAAEGGSVFGQAPARSVADLKDLQGKYRPIKNAKNHEKLKELSNQTKNKNIPDDWSVKVSQAKKNQNQGLEYVHPENDRIRVRVMPGDPNSQFPNSREPYVRQTTDYGDIDKNGNIVKKDSNEAHIPLKNYKFKKFWRVYGKK